MAAWKTRCGDSQQWRLASGHSLDMWVRDHPGGQLQKPVTPMQTVQEPQGRLEDRLVRLPRLVVDIAIGIPGFRRVMGAVRDWCLPCANGASLQAPTFLHLRAYSLTVFVLYFRPRMSSVVSS